ncbi:MAG TPA: SIS domain-containing protein [Chthoniobacterales bacterium]|nr:SIS domain-containing protein [Chthoniobacterales bacterium]
MQNSPAKVFQSAIASATETLRRLEQSESIVIAAADLIVNCLNNGHKLLVCGNGGSAADAADFCTEFACRFEKDRRPYPALNLSQGGSLLTATANDYGFDEVFARQVRAFGQRNDLLIGITTSGNSRNVQRALQEAKAQGLKTIALLGREGGSCTGIAEVELLVSGTSTARIQEAHKFLLHVVCEICENHLNR